MQVNLNVYVWTSGTLAMAESVDSASTVKKAVFVSFSKRNRPVEFTGGMEELTVATKETFRDLGNKDHDIFFQLRDEDWGGLFVDVVDASKIPDRSVLKAVVVKSDLVSFKYAQSCAFFFLLFLQFICQEVRS